MNELKLELTLEEVNVLLEALGSHPFKQVHQLISKIQTQATGQLQQVPPTGDSEANEDN